jgi:hypothetical protein
MVTVVLFILDYYINLEIRFLHVEGVPEKVIISASDSILQKCIHSIQFACSNRTSAG